MWALFDLQSLLAFAYYTYKVQTSFDMKDKFLWGLILMATEILLC